MARILALRPPERYRSGLRFPRRLVTAIVLQSWFRAGGPRGAMRYRAYGDAVQRLGAVPRSRSLRRLQRQEMAEPDLSVGQETGPRHQLRRFRFPARRRARPRNNRSSGTGPRSARYSDSIPVHAKGGPDIRVSSARIVRRQRAKRYPKGAPGQFDDPFGQHGYRQFPWVSQIDRSDQIFMAVHHPDQALHEIDKTDERVCDPSRDMVIVSSFRAWRMNFGMTRPSSRDTRGP